MKSFFYFIQLFLILISFNYLSAQCEYDDVQDVKYFSNAELKTRWKVISADLGMKSILKELSTKNMKEISDKESSYGFKCKAIQNNKIVEAEFFTKDFYDKMNNSYASIIWKVVGKKVYKAYILFPKLAKDKDIFDALEQGEEFYCDGQNNIQLAHSWRKCFKKCVFKRCPLWCGAAIGTCAGAIGTIATAVAIGTGGLGAAAFPQALAAFGICAGVSCGLCFATCAIGCE